MNSNQKGRQGSKQSDRDSANKQSGSQGSGSRSDRGTQGGTHEQHVEAGRQSHKIADKVGSRPSGGSGSGRKSDSNR